MPTVVNGPVLALLGPFESGGICKFTIIGPTVSASYKLQVRFSEACLVIRVSAKLMFSNAFWFVSWIKRKGIYLQ